ncbi:choline kinase, putative [Theileria annulata]|uniref:Choline kinase, putative n=1 Tax=Theileria annulata TaxID=5874 RepID=Q4UH91_THEAN|nr:choline kinase, putative [Theileria annulata]CAI73548.1 choline kinase, putative [Theileria annulata]|eukprot:XP_954225.1 choline kinase, putative [Theileria annulata]
MRLEIFDEDIYKKILVPNASRNTSYIERIEDSYELKLLCKKYVPFWSELDLSDIEINLITIALTNKVYMVRVVNGDPNSICLDKVLLRIIDEDKSILYDIEHQNDVFKLLSEYGFCPKMINKFPGGRIENWIEGFVLHSNNLFNLSVLTSIATLLAKLHKIITKVAPKNWDRTPSLIYKTEEWIPKCHYINQYYNLNINLYEIDQLFLQYKSFLTKYIEYYTVTVSPVTVLGQTASNGPTMSSTNSTKDISSTEVGTDSSKDIGAVGASTVTGSGTTDSNKENTSTNNLTTTKDSTDTKVNSTNSSTKDIDTIGASTVTEGKGANFTLTECNRERELNNTFSTSGKGANSMPMECTSEKILNEIAVVTNSRESSTFSNTGVSTSKDSNSKGDTKGVGEEVGCHDTDPVTNIGREYGMKIVFCHNDMHIKNFIATYDGLTLIDFDYSSFNYVGADIGYFFIESNFDYDCDEYPFFKLDRSLELSYELKTMFASVYLSESLGFNVLPNHLNIIDPFLETIELFSIGTLIFWAYWGIIM